MSEHVADAYNAGRPVRAIYMGLPVTVERDPDDPDGAIVSGFWSRVLTLLPFNGVFFLYRGSYLRALTVWLFDIGDER